MLPRRGVYEPMNDFTGGRARFQWRVRERVFELGTRTLIMGVVNITPDSCSDGGRFLEPARAVAHCLDLIEQGADILDLGAESSRPGADPVSAAEEADRLLPVLEQLRRESNVSVSIDTYKSAVARQAIEGGAQIVNDISCFRFDPSMARLVAGSGAGVVLMHMRGQPRNMQKMPPSPDIAAEIRGDLAKALKVAYSNGIERDRIVLDPGIGFGKTVADNLLILNRLSMLEEFRLPILVGASRKSFLGRILGVPEDRRDWGTAAAVAASILRGAHLVRVHDAGRMRMVADVTDAILAEEVRND